MDCLIWSQSCYTGKISSIKNFTLNSWICAVHGHEPTIPLQSLQQHLASQNIFHDFTCILTVALVQDNIRQSMMIIVFFDAKTQSFSSKTFHSTHMSGCCCKVLAKYLTCILLLQCNSWCKPLLSLSSSRIGLIWNNAARYIQVNGVKVFLYETSRPCNSKYTCRITAAAA